MKPRRRFLAALGAAAYVATFGVRAQGGRRRVAFLGPLGSPGNGERIAALRAGLLGQGLVEGQGFSIEFRGEDRGIETLRGLANALVRSGVHMIVAHGAAEAIAARQATQSIPIVMAAANDAVALRLVADGQRPGGNVTGLTYSSPQMMQRRLELLRQTYIRSNQVAVLSGSTNPMADRIFTALQATAKGLGVTLSAVTLRPGKAGAAFVAMREAKTGSFVITDDSLPGAMLAAVTDIAAGQRMPGIGPRGYVEAGGVMSYAVNDLWAWGRAARFVARILRGANPADLPLEAATRFETVLSRKGARSAGIALPQSMVARADRVIEAVDPLPCERC